MMKFIPLVAVAQGMLGVAQQGQLPGTYATGGDVKDGYYKARIVARTQATGDVPLASSVAGTVYMKTDAMSALKWNNNGVLYSTRSGLLGRRYIDPSNLLLGRNFGSEVTVTVPGCDDEEEAKLRLGGETLEVTAAAVAAPIKTRL